MKIDSIGIFKAKKTLVQSFWTKTLIYVKFLETFNFLFFVERFHDLFVRVLFLYHDTVFTFRDYNAKRLFFLEGLKMILVFGQKNQNEKKVNSEAEFFFRFYEIARVTSTLRLLQSRNAGCLSKNI